MRFFDDEPARPTRTGADWEHYRETRHAHNGPPQDEVGVLALSGFQVVRSADVAIALSGITAYSDGLLLHVVVLFADEQRREVLDWSLQEYSRSPGRFRVGVEFSDGTRAAAGTSDAPSVERTSTRATLTLLTNSAVPLRWQGDYWLHPLPTPGSMVLACRWPDRGIDETLVSVEVLPLLQAAKASSPVWLS